ncbi:carboxylate-amine ligase [Brevirhabdus pacifica]|uniref:Putative glutamate--cysteine ligase 2 n=1 Tax=Brevirhabdus pacifica TaxID=1267768 RepID=A0A1U7DLC1_9RHOB|nr:carboxylate-amine ligase [Brevirhabdus pacifica]APX90715.1 carboxylate-amine ligase [Brevirhabdus pacifica]OWU78312.1 carboxylate--amine ligase [Loktanella sp. 22II-4b]PJJ85129.1 carboxylate-amine ligase [Brevirhabdus pacifica]
MASSEPEFSIGIEEEYLLVDRDSLALAEAPDALMEACREELQDKVSPEFMQCQIEIGTGVCQTIAEAREELRHLRSCVARNAKRFNLAPIAASCHPSADWKDQHHTPKERYDQTEKDLAAVARRMLICGMHVHVGLNDDETRIALMEPMTQFLPQLLALSTSSPYWQGDDTGLCCYRLSVFDNMPRTGLPPKFHSWDQYCRTTGVLVDVGILEDTTKIWWDLRPSDKYPTLETRIFDVNPRVEHALSLAAANQALMRMLWRLRARNLKWREHDRFLVNENRWRAQRYGVNEGLIDFGRGEIVPPAEMVENLLELLEQDAGVLQSGPELETLREIVEHGTSADRQRAVAQKARDGGADEKGAMDAVVRHLMEEFSQDL